MKERESLEDCLAKAWRSGRCRLGRVVDAGARAVSLDAATGLHAVAPCAALAGGRCLIRPFAVDSADADGEAADAGELDETFRRIRGILDGGRP